MVDLSIIIPSYNNARYLKTCIGSIVPGKAALQIIVIDDGSTDDTQAVLTELTSDRPELEIITQDNQGVSAARNAGILQAKGVYVMFVDADDRLDCEPLSFVTGTISDSNSDVFICRSFSGKKEHYKWEGVFEEDRLYSGSELMQKHYVRGSVCGCIFRRSFLVDNEMLFDPALSLGEDTVFFARTLALGARFSFVNQRLYETSVRDDSASRSYDDSFFTRYADSAREIRSSISDRRIADNTILTFYLGMVHVAAKSGYGISATRKLTAPENVLPLDPNVFEKNRWLVRVLNTSFPLFYLIKKWKDKLL